MSRVTEAHLEARRSEILHAAFHVFSRRGVQSATMAEIADEAGVSAGAIYRYFPSKEELAARCLTASGERMAAEWHRQVEDADDALGAFQDIARSSFEEMKEPGADDLTRLMMENILGAVRSGDHALRIQVRDERRTIAAGLAEAIEAARAAGQIPSILDSKHLADALLSFYMGARLARMVDEEADTDGQLAQLWTLLELAAHHS